MDDKQKILIDAAKLGKIMDMYKEMLSLSLTMF